MKRPSSLLFGLLTGLALSAQPIIQKGAPTRIDFDQPTEGVNQSQYNGSGRTILGDDGRLNSYFWAGFGQDFAASNPGGNYAGGVLKDPEATSKPSFYAAEPQQSGDRAFAFTANNDRPPAFDFRYKIGSDLSQIHISLDAFAYKMVADRTTGLNAYYAIDPSGTATDRAAVDALQFKPLPELDILPSNESPEGQWIQLGNINAQILEAMKADQALILRFQHANQQGRGGNRTLLAIDNLSTYVDIPEFRQVSILFGLIALLRTFSRRRKI